MLRMALVAASVKVDPQLHLKQHKQLKTGSCHEGPAQLKRDVKYETAGASQQPNIIWIASGFLLQASGVLSSLFLLRRVDQEKPGITKALCTATNSVSVSQFKADVRRRFETLHKAWSCQAGQGPPLGTATLHSNRVCPVQLNAVQL